MITIVNYGLGNVDAFANTYKRMNIPVVLATTPADLDAATHIILPGVGAFDHAMELLSSTGMRTALENAVQEGNVPVLGVCVGMQILANMSEEGSAEGLGWIKGAVRNFSGNPGSAPLPMPHMGWNDVTAKKGSPLFKGLEEDARFYFLHSYYFDASNEEDACAHANYGFTFACAVQRGNVYGVQFHPEKSHRWGAALLKNFAQI